MLRKTHVQFLGGGSAVMHCCYPTHSLSGYPPPRREARKDVSPTLSARAHGGGGPGSYFDIDGGLIPSTKNISHCLNAGGMGRQDYESETLIAHALSAEGFDASEDGSPPHERRPVRGDPGTGRGTPLVPIALCTAHTQSNGSGFSDDIAHTLEMGGSAHAVALVQNSRDEIRLHGGDGATIGALAAQSGAKQQCYVAFSAKDDGADAASVVPTLRSMGHDASRPNGGGQIAVAFTQNQSGDVLSGEVMQSLGTNANSTGRNAANVAVTWSGELTASTDVAGTLQRGGEGGRIDGVMTPLMAVRRLTPRECERLQGFPDDYTRVEYRGKLASDSPRYRALGNSMAVPVMRWLGERIAAVDAIVHATGSASRFSR